MSDRLLTAREVADQLAVSTETTLRWTRRGQLPAVRLPGGAIRYRPAELAGWLDEHSTADAPGREVSPTRTGDARRVGAYSLLSSASSPTTPLDGSMRRQRRSKCPRRRRARRTGWALDAGA
jgi:excisionase family DNA binding protein